MCFTPRDRNVTSPTLWETQKWLWVEVCITRIPPRLHVKLVFPQAGLTEGEGKACKFESVLESSKNK